ncbi:MAG: hypothetical protein RL514_123 [Verrucomicrobiota bacterium]
MHRADIGRCWAALLCGVALSQGAAAEGFAPLDESLYAMGRYVYERNCLVCHGRWGDGDGEMAKGMIPQPRKFSAGIFKYRSTPGSALPTNDDLMRTIRGGRANTSMPYFTQLSDREVRAVVEFIKFFSPKWRKPENYAAPVRLPEPPAWLAQSAESATRATKGKATFALACVACHGEHADGKGVAAAGLKDVWGAPALPADLRASALRNGRTPADLFRVLTLGIHGTPMPSFAEALTEGQRWELAAFIGTLRPPVTAEK